MFPLTLLAVTLVLDAAGKAAFQTYLDKGGNFIAVHSASDTLRTTQSYIRELGETNFIVALRKEADLWKLGAQFQYHPPLQNAV